MQQLCIAGESVLTFFDRGSNTHLVDGELAKCACFKVIDDTCTLIGVIRGGDIWTEYGVYGCILGPDANVKFHELECQGLAKVMSVFPKLDLRPLHPEVYRTPPQDWSAVLPDFIGGDWVKLLIGIRSSAIHPPLRPWCFDVNGSFMCFGGPHEVFTRGYARSGVSANHLQVYFTQIATAYLRSPYTFPPPLRTA
jgi:hypothetical protein